MSHFYLRSRTDLYIQFSQSFRKPVHDPGIVTQLLETPPVFPDMSNQILFQ
ncbi:hypothetical protein ECP02989426_3251 [Escherichia coli P0298942.6]|nr:hypothetical protein EC2845350_3357 [Escherichia coli 2845350]ENB35250.1 hypothetical protein ECMP0215613_3184 [Escherichia coli MP021561.3]ENB46752.1 hypothetical protein ECP029894211_3343 [Escherichia coli P0298942.11]ENB59512.1 hypothetical protein ECP029894215_3324 [Escherichia coli P0298942.15]ENB59872.1 hypothetical protein ECP02989426_3251 [Escherichia coli P0298942.6]ENB74630.1 hypothetical protein ECP02989428_3215 [Escherichia coli P0298942.8]ENB76444.1 hypothetical protein ECP029